MSKSTTESPFARTLRLAAASLLALSLVGGIGTSAAHAQTDERRPPIEQEFRESDGDVCDWYSCWLYTVSCFASGGTSESLVDDSGNMAVICHEKKKES